MHHFTQFRLIQREILETLLGRFKLQSRRLRAIDHRIRRLRMKKTTRQIAKFPAISMIKRSEKIPKLSNLLLLERSRTIKQMRIKTLNIAKTKVNRHSLDLCAAIALRLLRLNTSKISNKMQNARR